MARYDDALAAGGTAVPRLADVRRLQSKRRWGLALDQALSSDLGGFVRAGPHDGAAEVYSFAAIDDAVPAGLVLRGRA